MMPVRHDLVWLHPGGEFLARGAAPEVVQTWVARQLPLVAARRSPGQPEQLNLGFTLPDVEKRQRVSVAVSPAQVRRCSPPPSLLDVIPILPCDWRPSLMRLTQALRSEGLEARVFGSVVTLFFTEEPCLRPDSDLDLLLDCRDERQVAAALKILPACTGTPRLDGELRFPSGWSVCWRELAAVWSKAGIKVLAKSDQAVALLALADLGFSANA